MPGALSALGILLADVVRDYSRTVMLPGNAINNLEGGLLEDEFKELERQGAAEFAAENLEGTAHRSVDIRYRRQGYELNVPYDGQSLARTLEAFHSLHLQRYGFCDVERAVEIVNLRLRMVAAAEPYEPSRHDPVPGDGCAAYYAERPVYFDGGFRPTSLYRRHLLVPGDLIRGPAMITEYTAATLVPPGCTAAVDGLGNLILSIAEEERR
jgi:N-methylhydantoinase A